MNTRIWKFMILVVMLAMMAGLLLSGPVAAATPEPPPGATQVREADGAVMVYVPAGEFLMGSLFGEGKSDEWPQHIVYLDGFWTDRTEVTNRQFETFVQATGYRTEAEKEGTGEVWMGDRSPYPQSVEGADWRHPEGPDSSIAGLLDAPVVQVTRDDAQAYCQWAGARLPTEAEWEKAACGTDGRRYPWGNEKPSCQYAVMQDSSGVGCGQGRKPWPVGSKPAGASPYGALDMLGNVWEKVADWYDPDYYAHSPASNPQGPASGSQIIWRGGSFVRGDIDHDWLRCATREPDSPTWRGKPGGFRCAVPAPTAAVPAEAAAPPAGPAPASRVLFIGDSDSRFLDRYLPRLAASGEAPIAIESKAFATTGASLGLYDILGRYAWQEIRSGHWKVVVLQQDLDRTWRLADKFCNDAREFHKIITEVGAKTVLFLPWDNASIPPPPTLQDTAAVYTTCGVELGVKVAPVGLAFERASRERPILNLYVADGTHANLRGLYLTLCVLYATLFERSPVGLTYRMDDVAAWSLEYAVWGLDREQDWQISAEEAAFLQRIAWETVGDYRAQHPVK
jgi:sulfatase modifying factor 1